MNDSALNQTLPSGHRGAMVLRLARAVWLYRGFVLGSVKREFQAKYRNSLLGALWTVLQPLAMVIVYTVIFSEIMRPRIPGMTGAYAYSIYLCAGVLTWGLFSEIVQRSVTVFLDNGNMIKKLSFPRICLPVIVILNALVNFVIIFSIFIVFLAATGKFPGWITMYTLPVLAVEMIFGIGLGIISGVLNVFFRDVGQFVTIVMQFWFWLTPIIYSAQTLPSSLRPLMKYNPMAPLMQAFQDIYLYGRSPNWNDIWPVAILGIVLCAAGLILFRRRSSEMVDEL